MLTVEAAWPVDSSATRKRSRTNAVSSATMTVFGWVETRVGPAHADVSGYVSA